MKKPIYIWQFFGFVFTGLMGVFLHFLFDITNGNIVAALFSAVNESIFEHLKLLFFPMFLYAIIESRYIGNDYKKFWCVKLKGIFFGVVSIPLMYYTLNGIFGTMPDWVNILIFFVAAALSYIIETRMLENGGAKCKYPKVSMVVLLLVSLIFMMFTFLTPEIPLFKDPITNTYGI